ncbi:MAG: recombinase family protein [Elainellaceae cyanobacterium]
MSTVAYCYSDPLLESPPDVAAWGGEVSRLYCDLGDRHQLQQLLQDCRHAQDLPDAVGIEAVLVRRLDELGETVAEVGDRLGEFEALGVSLIAVDEPLETGDQPLKRSDLLALVNSIQKRQSTRRIRQGHARNRVNALPPPGKAPYGYRRGKDRYALDRSTAPVVKDFVEYFLLYGSLRGSVRYLERKYNKKISVSTGKRWLTSPVYRGDLAYRNGDVVSDTHLSIISRDEAAQVDRLLRRNRRLPPRTASAPRSLAGLVVCGVCQSAMKVARTTYRRKKREYLYLRPVACPKEKQSDPSCQGACRAVPYQTVLDLTIEQICADLPHAVAKLELPDLDGIKGGIRQQMSAKEAILAQLPDLQSTGVLDEETATLRSYKLRSELSVLREKLAQLPPVNLKAIAQTVSIRQFWLDLSESERRFYFREFIRQVQLMRASDDSGDSGDSGDSDDSDADWTLTLDFIF